MLGGVGQSRNNFVGAEGGDAAFSWSYLVCQAEPPHGSPAYAEDDSFRGS